MTLRFTAALAALPGSADRGPHDRRREETVDLARDDVVLPARVEVVNRYELRDLVGNLCVELLLLRRVGCLARLLDGVVQLAVLEPELVERAVGVEYPVDHRVRGH